MQLERLWAGWRIGYVSSASAEEPRRDGECVFCRLPVLEDEEALIVERAAHAYTVLNLYPYNTGHVMVVPYRHVGEIDALDDGEAADVMRLVRRATAALRSEYTPDGTNIGANLGKAAGAGIPAHFHMHVVPRWSGDTNFITVVGGVKVLPEELPDTWRRLHARLAVSGGAGADSGA
jgi:ATP adenylyltransferase